MGGSISCDQKAELQVAHAMPVAESSGPGTSFAPWFLLDSAEQRISSLQSEAGTDFEVQLRFGKVEDVVRDAALAQEVT